MPSGRYGIGCGVILDKLDDTQEHCEENNYNGNLYELGSEKCSINEYGMQYCTVYPINSLVLGDLDELL